MRRALAGRAESEDFEMVTVDREFGVARKLPHQVLDRAAGEGNDDAARGADEMMPVPGLPDDVRRMSVGLQQTRQKINGRQDFERSIDCCPANCRKLRHQLLGGEGPAVSQHCLDHRPAR